MRKKYLSRCFYFLPTKKYREVPESFKFDGLTQWSNDEYLIVYLTFENIFTQKTTFCIKSKIIMKKLNVGPISPHHFPFPVFAHTFPSLKSP